MDDENNSIISWLKGMFGGGSASPKTYLADPRKDYPTDDDVDFARKYDYSYGQPWAPEFEGHSARLLSSNVGARPLRSELLGTDKTTVDKLIPGVTDPLKNYYAKAALASEGSALAKLGFDPNRTVLDLLHKPDEVSAEGAYLPKQDQIYANARVNDPSTIIHESIHRGLHKLKDTPFWKPEFDEFASDKNFDMNEYLARYLMKSKMGDPESSGTGAFGKAQRGAAELAIGRNERRKALVDQIEAAAAQAVAAKRPGGPR